MTVCLTYVAAVLISSVAETQLHEIISADDAWTVTDESPDDESGEKADALKPTTSARQVRTLIEQITGECLIPDSATLTGSRPLCPPPVARVSPPLSYHDPATPAINVQCSHLRVPRCV